MDNNLSNKFKKIIIGDINCNFTMLAFSMLMTRLISKYKASPNPETLDLCISEIEKFIIKYNSILTKDLAIVNKL